MLRSMLIVSCLLACSGCSAAHRSLAPSKEGAEEPAPAKDYKYKDMSTGSSAFYRH